MYVPDIFSNHVFPARYMIELKCVNIEVGEGRRREGFSIPLPWEGLSLGGLQLDKTESTRDNPSYHQRVMYLVL